MRGGEGSELQVSSCSLQYFSVVLPHKKLLFSSPLIVEWLCVCVLEREILKLEKRNNGAKQIKRLEFKFASVMVESTVGALLKKGTWLLLWQDARTHAEARAWNNPWFFSRGNQEDFNRTTPIASDAKTFSMGNIRTARSWPTYETLGFGSFDVRTQEENYRFGWLKEKNELDIYGFGLP